MADMARPKYLSLRDLSRHSSLSVQTLRHFLSDPVLPLPHYRMPRKILVNIEEFQEWFARFRVQPEKQDLDKLVKELMTAIQCDPARKSSA